MVRSINAMAQDTKEQIISIHLKDAKVVEAFRHIEKNSSFKFLYDKSLESFPKRVTIQQNKITVAAVLQEIDRQTGLQFNESNNTIAVSYKSQNNLGATSAQAAARHEVTGVVKDSTGLLLVGVTVAVKNGKTGTGTDVNGRFVLNVQDDDVLVFSLIGYRTMEVPVNKRKHIEVIMQLATSALEEVVVVGFGQQKKISLVGAQATIAPKELKLPTSNLTNSLGGRVAGLVSVQRTGELGYNDANIYIRGISTFSSGLSAPLTLVDGVPRDIANIDPEDIESFSVLKDASATAVYGVRGANGVILITTKSGKAGKANYNVRYSEGITAFTKLPEFTDGATYMEMSNEALTTRGNAPVYSDDAIQQTRDGSDPYLYPSVDWFDEIFNKTGHVRNANANINGGSENAIYYVGLGYYDELGLYKTDDLSKYNSSIYLKRYNVTSNLTLKPSKTTTIKLGLQGYLSNVNLPTTGVGDLFDDAYFMSPIQIPTKYPDGKVADIRSGGLSNPWASLTQKGYANQWRSQIYSNLRLTQELPFITKGLSVTGMFSFDAYNYTSNRYTKSPDTYLATGRDDEGNLVYEQTAIGTEYLEYTKSNQGERTFYTEAALNYAREFGAHNVTGMLLYNQSDLINTYASNLESSLPYRFQGLAGRFTYGYQNRYFVEANFGYNGSENFAPDNRFGFFPSGGLGWVMSEESFFKPLKKYIQQFKVRFSHGIVGNSNISGRRFAYLSTVSSSTGGYTFGKDLGTSYPNKGHGKEIGEYGVDVQWETSRKTNLGFDITLLGESLTIQADLFKEHRSGIFLRRTSLPAYVGMINQPFGNVGIIDNKGIDLSMNYNKRFGDWNISLLGNFTYNRNEVVENDDPAWKYPWLERKGQKVGQRYGYVAMGLFESDDEVKNAPRQTGDVRAGDIRYKDINGDGVINSYDEVPIGYGNIPEIVYGFGFTVGYKSFALSTLFQGAANVDFILSGEGTMPFQQGLGRGNLFNNINDRWTEANPRQDVFYPRLASGSVNDNFATSTWWLKNANYLRLKTLQVSYNLPKHWMQQMKLKSANIFLQGINVLTFSPFKLWDVELGDGRGAAYPSTASYSAGIAINF
ncbi:SusC/RagA family TonB-linked outer membrane protein [Chitinophaga caeni]|uniref:SusC/RagA family TonB-linked outer membrane protein n=2 Tax=Chitinophaga caeni TaxID=2029983 RepID=A0A291R0N1_9BACT|nr:SusC/RagA family TonB-linked outer membrane protein [Chitinophaga caeni]